jgi:hypothetical protein
LEVIQGNACHRRDVAGSLRGSRGVDRIHGQGRSLLQAVLRTPQLPGVTIATLDWARVTIAYWYLFVLALIVFDGGLLLGLQFLPNRWSWVRSLWFVGFLTAVLLHLGWSCIALDVPVNQFDAAQAARE